MLRDQSQRDFVLMRVILGLCYRSTITNGLGIKF